MMRQTNTPVLERQRPWEGKCCEIAIFPLVRLSDCLRVTLECHVDPLRACIIEGFLAFYANIFDLGIKFNL